MFLYKIIVYYKSISAMVSNMLLNCYFFVSSYLYINDKIENRNLENKNVDNLITVMEREIYEIERDYYESNETCYMNNSKSAPIIIHRCGYCMQNVGTPTFRYNDNTFCDKYCRDKQINNDNKGKYVNSRSHKSRSF
jgi:hypothetical protein